MPLTHADLLKLKRWNAPTISNALELITTSDRLSLTNLEEARDFMPEMGPMVGHAMTVVISGGDPRPKEEHPDNFRHYLEYLASQPEPKIVVIQDADKPACYGSIWGEVGANAARSLGCVGTITDGAIRDYSEMKNAGFKALARRLAVGHAHCWPLRWGVEVEVFGTKVRPGQLIHADQHGFIIIPNDAQERLLAAVRFMDDNECDTVIHATRSTTGRNLPEILAGMSEAAAKFGANTRRQYAQQGEWKK